MILVASSRDRAAMQLPSSKLSMMAGVLAAIGASVCCVGPLVLLGLGVSGAWIGNLVAVEPFRPIFIAVTLLFFVLAYRKLYRRAAVCATDAPCVDSSALSRQPAPVWV